MRLVTLVTAVLLLSCTSKKIHPVDAAYLRLLTQRIDSAGHNMDSVIQKCEQAMIDAGYFKNHESQNYIAFIESIQVSGDIAPPKWLIG
ncbi:MAG: hypothetical protein ACI8SE_000971 [Bacteroidia bacterium]|jgi:hypothetical protein